MTTASTFYGVFRDLALTGVTNINQSPMSLPSVKFPCKWVHSARIEESQLRGKAIGGDRTLRCVVVVVVGTAGQNTLSTRHADMLAMVDTLNAGIKTVAGDRSSWSVEADPNYGEIYLAVVAEIAEQEGSI